MLHRGKKSYKNASEGGITSSQVRMAAEFLGIGACLILLCSCISFNIGDWPSRFAYPHNDPPANWCGSIGAVCGYYLMYYLGPGVFVVLVTAICFLFARMTHHSTSSGDRREGGQLVFRAIGLGLVTVAVSTSVYCLWPYRFYGFPMGSGGVLGIGVARFLQSYFAVLGTFLLLTAIWVVGIALLTDNLIRIVVGSAVFVAGKAIGWASAMWSAVKRRLGVFGEVWQKLRTKSVPRPSWPTTRKVEDIIKPVRVEEPKPVAVKPRGSEKELRKPAEPYVPPSFDDYTLPPLELLAEPEYGFGAVQEKVVKSKASDLERLLSEFSVNARVVAAETGPVVTMFELELAAGVKVSQISALANDMARAMGVGAVRVVAPLPGKHTIGIEVPNSEKEKVRMRNMMELSGDRPKKMQIPLFLGKDSSGEALVSDLTTMPHLLIAGTTGSGKSVCINSIITSILLTKRPDEVKMILIDPKMVEMTAFNTIPHLMCPIVTETQMAVQILEWATVKMDERYSILAEARVKNVAEYNNLGADEIIRRFAPGSPEEEQQIPKKLVYIMIIIDELADLMMTAAKEIEAYIVRLAQKSRAVGIHIVLATQRPQATVVTGLIKSNMPTRVGFRVAARLDSRIVLDQNGAETLLGEGDMLFLKPGTSDLVRAQGTFVDDAEIKRIVKHLKDVAEPQFHPELTRLKRLDTADMVKDELFDDAIQVVLQTQRGSVSLLQRRLNVGYARASRMIEMMAATGILGDYKGSQAREVIMTLDEYERAREQMEAEAERRQHSAGAADLSEPACVNEGQKGYVATDSDEE